MRTSVESRETFDARIAAEDIEASAVACPLDSCRAAVGEPCRTEDGVERLRHCRRLWLARKTAQES
jgi:hypothetical protein